MSDPVDDRLQRLTERIGSLPPPPGLEARVLARLRKRSQESRWELTWSACRSAVPLAFVAAALAVCVAIWQDVKLTDALAHSPDSISDAEVKDP